MNEPPAKSQADKKHSCPVRQALKKQVYHRAASLTDVEKAFLSSLLIDCAPTKEEEHQLKKKTESANKMLTDDILFSLPFVDSSLEEISDSNHKAGRKKSMPPAPTRSNPQLGVCDSR